MKRKKIICFDKTKRKKKKIKKKSNVKEYK